MIVNISHDFSGRQVLVTGGTSGIGAATAELFRKAGAEVIIAGTRGNAGDSECCIARRSAGWESPKT